MLKCMGKSHWENWEAKVHEEVSVGDIHGAPEPGR